MRRQIDHFLLGLLWLLAVTLGANFWFNAQFGFNIFSAPHWEYLGQLQAARVPVNIWFYISMVAAVIIMIGGLYILIRPRFRKIRLSPVLIDNPKEDASEIQMPRQELAVDTTSPVNNEPYIPHTIRPPKLNLGNIDRPLPLAPNKIMTAPAESGMQPQNTITPSLSTNNVAFAEIKEIFELAGYLVKKSPRIGGFRPALLAIGANESLWIGGISIEAAKLSSAVEKLSSIFTDTLQDIEIHIHPFIVAPQSEANTTTPSISMFDTMEDLRQYMNDNKSIELTGSEKDDFDAYSEYIDTVIDYLGNI